MKYDEEIYDQITALVDNELSKSKSDDLKKLISKEKQLEREYNIQSSVKKLLHNRFADQKAPTGLRKKILGKIT